MNFSTHQYPVAAAYFVGSIVMGSLAYVFYRTEFVLRARIGYGLALIAIGVLFFVFAEASDFVFSSIALFTVPYVNGTASAAALIVVASIVAFVLVVLALQMEGEFKRERITRKRLMPFIASAILLFLTGVAIISAIQFEYAVPITLVLMGVLVLSGLRRFAVTTTALGFLLICMLIFGSAAGGYYAVTYVSENRYLTSAQAPNASTANLHVKTLEGDVKIYFVKDSTTICHIDFTKEYGAVAQGSGYQFHDKNAYDGEPATTFNYTVANGEANITAIASTVLVNITLSQNYRYNLNVFTYFGGITLYYPTDHGIVQATNFTSRWGYVAHK